MCYTVRWNFRLKTVHNMFTDSHIPESWGVQLVW